MQAARCTKICIAFVGQIHRDKSDFHKTMYMYTRGRYMEGEWVFGGICRETKACFFIVVRQRDKDTLLAIIHAHILSGTNVISDMWRASMRLPKSEPQPKLRKPKHRCAHPAHWKYLVGSQMKYAFCRNIRGSLLKLSTGMVVAPVVWRWSFWIHYQAYRRLVWSTQRCLNCSLFYCMHCSWSVRNFVEGRNKIHRSFIAWDWIGEKKSRAENAEWRVRDKQ